MAMFERLNAQQQPFISSGYGAMGKLNTLLGLGGGRGAPSAGVPMVGGQMAPMAGAPQAGGGEMPLGGGATLMPRYSQDTIYHPKPNGGIRMQPALGSPQNIRIKQLLALRAANGDTEAQRVLGGI